uniref:Cysteine-rich membrane protein 2 n=1 Tax=Spironucleus salmonicida TaxID=348837 RepID=V6LW69_9EUKA|eukprot:EST47956.1 Cysteine-rich membrane protein 2 [Spironucleus salmonicida]
MGAAGSCSDESNKCGSPYYCPLDHHESTACLLCNPSQPVGTSCQCGKKYTIHPNCAGCNGEDCIACTQNFFLLNSKCEACIANCTTCSSNTTCDSCFAGYFANASKVCQKCSENCQTCSTETSCLTCFPNQFLTPEKSCHFCAKNCEKCQVLTACDVCKDGYFPAAVGCEKCGEAMKIGDECQCAAVKIANCVQCAGAKCATCKMGYKLILGTCVPDQCQVDKNCQIYEFCDVSATKPNACRSCSKLCKTCSGADDHCTSCQEGQFLAENTCQPCDFGTPAGFSCNCGTIMAANCGKCLDDACASCIDGFIMRAAVCVPCAQDQIQAASCTCHGQVIAGCVSCSAKGCDACKPNFKLIDNACLPNECQNTVDCKSGEFCLESPVQVNHCVSCGENCAVCQNADICTRCQSGFFRDSQSACAPCARDIQMGGGCQCGELEISNCAECGADTCKACRDKYDLRGGACIANECQDDSECGDGNFCRIRASGHKCAKCGKSCQSCKKSATNCTSCNSGQSLIGGVCDRCRFDSPAGTACNCSGKLAPNCGFCEKQNCLICANNFFLDGSVCAPCSDNRPIGSLCTCSGLDTENCALCGTNSCAKCVVGSKMIDGECRSDECGNSRVCEAGKYCQQFVDKINVCLECDVECQTCTMVGSCDLCSSGYFKTAQNCVLCDKIQNEECNCGEMMLKSCRMCEKDKCIQCAVGNSVREGVCVSCAELVEGEKCDCGLKQINCIKCGQENQCSVCHDGHILIKGKCVSCADNPQLCVNKISSNTIIFIVIGIIGGITLTFGAAVFVIIARKRKSNVNPDYDTTLLNQSNNSSSQLF